MYFSQKPYFIGAVTEWHLGLGPTLHSLRPQAFIPNGAKTDMLYRIDTPPTGTVLAYQHHIKSETQYVQVAPNGALVHLAGQGDAFDAFHRSTKS